MNTHLPQKVNFRTLGGGVVLLSALRGGGAAGGAVAARARPLPHAPREFARSRSQQARAGRSRAWGRGRGGRFIL